jgi:hypothetical protein
VNKRFLILVLAMIVLLAGAMVLYNELCWVLADVRSTMMAR